MATPRRASAPVSQPAVARSGRRRPLVGFTLGAALVASAAVGSIGGVATAAPQPSKAQVTAKVRTLQARADRLVESYDNATVALAAARQRSAQLATQLRAQQARTDQLRADINAMAVSAYQSAGNGTGSGMAPLLSSDSPQQFLDQASNLDAFARDEQAKLAQFAAAQAALDRLSGQAAAELAHRRQVQADMARSRRAIEHSLGQEQALLRQLSVADQRSLTTTKGTWRPQSAVSASGRAAKAISFAYAQLGKPYQWGAAGPGAYDCSGLTMRAWGAAGVALPHSAAGQFSVGRHVSLTALQPGDLLFYGSPISHVTLYVGGNAMIEAPHTGDVVKITSLRRADLVGAVRPG